MMRAPTPPAICVYCDHAKEAHEPDTQKCLKIVNNKICICRKFKEFQIPYVQLDGMDMNSLIGGILGGARGNPFKLTD